MPQIEQRRQVLRLATMEPHREPACPLTLWDYVMKEMRWMAVDFTEVSSFDCRPLEQSFRLPKPSHAGLNRLGQTGFDIADLKILHSQFCLKWVSCTM